jgi:DNA-directed RNA polymerase subunit RPC12/RpoP
MNETENTGEFSEETEETLETTDKKCPQCGGTLDFNPETGELVCTYCGVTVDIEDDEKSRAKELDFLNAENSASRDWGTEKRTVVCKNCGAETVYDAETVSGECPYCGSNQVMEAGGEDIMAPGGVCPFTVTKQTAAERFSGWLKGRLFCPGAAKKAAKAGKLTGIYLPYWTFDTQTYSDYTARYGKERRVRRGKETKTVINWYYTRGRYNRFINDELVCATTNHDRGMLGSIEPFDTEQNLEYKPEYLAGFASERYTLGLSDAWPQAKQGIRRKLESDVSQKVGREHHTIHVDSVRLHTTYSNVTYKYLLLPVWFSSFTYKGKNYRFMVNGRTGRVGGKYPISPLRVAIAVLLGICAAALLAYIFASGESDSAEIYIRNAESYFMLRM